MHPEPGTVPGCLINEWVGANSESESSSLIIELAQGALDELGVGWNQSKVALTSSLVPNTPLVKTFLTLLNIFRKQNCSILAPKSPLLGSLPFLLQAELSLFSCDPTVPSSHLHQTI